MYYTICFCNLCFFLVFLFLIVFMYLVFFNCVLDVVYTVIFSNALLCDKKGFALLIISNFPIYT
jgi:hypothetical protein